MNKKFSRQWFWIFALYKYSRFYDDSHAVDTWVRENLSAQKKFQISQKFSNFKQSESAKIFANKLGE